MAKATKERALRNLVTRAWMEARCGFQQLAESSDPATPSRIASGALIGPRIESRPIERSMDLDLLVITHQAPTAAFIRQAHGLLERIQNLGSSDLDVQFAMKDGPMKPSAHDRPVLFLHVLLHSIQSYRESPLTLVKRSWETEAQPFIGASPASLERLAPVSRDELLRSAIGIHDCFELLQRLQTPFLEWTTTGDSDEHFMCLKTQPVTDDLAILETAIYCTLRCASNACRWLLGRSAGVGIQANTVDTFESFFGTSSWASTTRDAYVTKKLVRAGKVTVSPRLAETWQSRALDFLDILRSHTEAIPLEPMLATPSRSMPGRFSQPA